MATMMSKLGVLVVLVSVLGGCTSTTPVMQLGENRYTVGSQVRSGAASWAEVKQLALDKANAHCDSLGQQLVSSDIETHGVRGWTPREAEVTFECGPGQVPANRNH